MEGGDDGRVVDIDKMTVTLEPDRITKGGLHVPGKDRMEFRPPERKSLLGLDVLAIAKRGSKGDGVFKVPQERNLSSLSSLDEDEMSASSGVDDIQTNTSQSRRSYSSRHYREASSNSKETLYSEVCSTTSENNLPRKGHDGDIHSTRFSNDYQHSEMRAKEAISPDRGRYRSSHSRSPSRYDKEERSSERMEYRDEFRSEGRRVRQRHYYDSRGQSHDRDRHRQEQKYSGGYGRKQTRDESTSIHKSDKSDWDDGRWEWEDTPQRDNHSMDSRHYRPSPSPMLVGSSPDARLVSPWLGGHTPRSAAGSASPWDYISPSPTPIRASGSSIRASSSRHGRSSHQLSFSAESSKSLGEDNVAGENTSAEEHNEFTEQMCLEMEYNADRAWYDREEGSTMFDADSSSLFLGADTSFPKEAELAKRLTQKDGTLMTLSQSTKLSQLTADNAQWENRQLLRSGAVRGTEVQTEFDDEDERKVILLVHGVWLFSLVGMFWDCFCLLHGGDSAMGYLFLTLRLFILLTLLLLDGSQVLIFLGVMKMMEKG